MSNFLKIIEVMGRIVLIVVALFIMGKWGDLSGLKGIIVPVFMMFWATIPIQVEISKIIKREKKQCK